MRSFALGNLYESQNRIQQEFIDFAKQWQTTKEQWRDEPARKFQQESLGSIQPTLNRVAGSMQAFAETVRHADRMLADPERTSEDLV